MTYNGEAWEKFIDPKNPLLVSSIKSFEHSLQHYLKKDNEDDRRFAIVELDQAFELLFKGILLKNKIDPFGLLFSPLVNLVKGLLGQHFDMTKITYLHVKRNACQHEGSIPDERETEYLVNSTFKVLIDFLHDIHGILPEVIAEKIPALYLMNMETMHLPEPPNKPELLKSMENAAIALLLLHDFVTALDLISSIVVQSIDIIYYKNNGPPIEPDPSNEPLKMISIKSPGIPFNFDGTFNKFSLVPIAIIEYQYLLEKKIISEKDSKEINDILYYGLCRDLPKNAPKGAHEAVDQILKEARTFSNLLNLFLVARQFVMNNEITKKILEEYYDESNATFFGRKWRHYINK